MKNIYLIAAIVAAVFFAYITGTRIGAEKCRANIAENNIQNINNKINQNNKILGEINEKSIITDTDSIRNFLREKYTIAK